MPYATIADLRTRFGETELLQLTDRDGSDVVDEAPLRLALTDADATIDSYLGARFAVPVTPVPVLLKRIAGDLARAALHGNSITQPVKDAADAGLRTLRDLADGRATLPGAAPASAGANPATPNGTARVVAPARVLDRGSIADFLG